MCPACFVSCSVINHKFILFMIRLKKLLNTLTIVKQLDKNMVELRHWLRQTEYKLSTPVMFQRIDSREIQTQIKNHQVNFFSSSCDMAKCHNLGYEKLSLYAMRRLSIYVSIYLCMSRL